MNSPVLVEKLRIGELERDFVVIRDVTDYHAQQLGGQA